MITDVSRQLTLRQPIQFVTFPELLETTSMYQF